MTRRLVYYCKHITPTFYINVTILKQKTLPSLCFQSGEAFLLLWLVEGAKREVF